MCCLAGLAASFQARFQAYGHVEQESSFGSLPENTRYYRQLFGFVFSTFTDLLRNHVEVYAEMGPSVSQTPLELYHRLADNQISAFKTGPPHPQASRVDDCHMIQLLGLYSFELLNGVDCFIQDLVPRITSRQSRKTTPSDPENKIVRIIPEELDLKEEKCVRAGPDSSSAISKTPLESYEESSSSQGRGPLNRTFVAFSRLLQPVGLLDPPLEAGKVRVRWKCVSSNLLRTNLSEVIINTLIDLWALDAR